MSAQISIVINDGATTPVAHTFAPKGARAMPTGKNVALWRDQSVTSEVGFLSITETHAPKNSNKIEKFRWVIEVPTVETPAGGTTPVKAYSTVAAIEVYMHERASEQELKNIAAYLKNFTGLTYVSDAIVKRESAW